MDCRAEWDLDPDFLTVNHGSFGAVPRCVRDAQRGWQDRMERQPSRFMNRVLPDALRSAASDLAAFLNAEAADVVFVDNATTGCNAVLRSAALQPGDEILILSHVYGAVRNTVRHVARQMGARIVEAAVPFPDPTPETLLDAVQRALTRRTRLAVIDHITSPSALVLPIDAIVAACHAADVPVLIDGPHAPGQVDLDLRALGADWYVGNCHKWLCAPKGCAFLHAAPHRQDGLHPVTISHGYGRGFLAEFDWTGTSDPSRFLSITSALAFHARLGGRAFRARNIALAAEAGGLLAARLNTRQGATGASASGMATVQLPVRDATPETALALRGRLMEAGTDAPVHALDGALWLRVSAFAYNQRQDYERLGDLVAGVLRAFPAG